MLTDVHIQWLLQQLEIRSLPQLTGSQMKQLTQAQSVVEEALVASLSVNQGSLEEKVVPIEKGDGDGAAPAAS
jgi:hypothetical protein